MADKAWLVLIASAAALAVALSVAVPIMRERLERREADALRRALEAARGDDAT